ncbi:MAG: hypothetical protein ACQKBY_11225 [Verrucomicrobiales bacterium]
MKKKNTLSTVLLAFASLFRFGGREEVCNAYAESPHPHGNIGKTAEAAFPQRNLLAIKGTAAQSIALGTATDEPLGTVADTPSIGDRANVRHLGASTGTTTMVGSKALAENVRVYTTAGGKITDTAVNGSWLVGKTTEACSGDGVDVEVVPCFPVEQSV